MKTSRNFLVPRGFMTRVGRGSILHMADGELRIIPTYTQYIFFSLIAKKENKKITLAEGEFDFQ